jgi:hypothetical protein|tara:strand:- start:295 stop:1185 length:891 start_codon:yes stop_codon:yes gene_type:complete
MVVFLIKNSAEDTFLFEATCDTPSDELVRMLAIVWNYRVLIKSLCDNCARLAEFGPAKEEKKRGLDSIIEEHGGITGSETLTKGPHYKADPMGDRTGNACAPQLAEVIMKTVADARAAVAAEQVARKVAMTLEMLGEKMANLRGAVTIAYPMGLPAWDAVRFVTENEEALVSGDLVGDLQPHGHDPASCTLWFAGKEFFRDEGATVRDRVKHERSKVSVKLAAKHAGAPAREPGVTEDERKAMMAHYYKKQQEAKALAEDDEDDFMHSAWANPANLKQTLHGTGGGLMFRAGGGRI